MNKFERFVMALSPVGGRENAARTAGGSARIRHLSGGMMAAVILEHDTSNRTGRYPYKPSWLSGYRYYTGPPTYGRLYEFPRPVLAVTAQPVNLMREFYPPLTAAQRPLQTLRDFFRLQMQDELLSAALFPRASLEVGLSHAVDARWQRADPGEKYHEMTTQLGECFMRMFPIFTECTIERVEPASREH